MNIKEFFEVLYPKFDLNNNVVEVRPFNIHTSKPENRKFISKIDEITKYSSEIDKEQKYHVFFECPELKATAKNGTEDSVLRYPFLYSDLDPNKKDEDGNIIRTYTKEELLQRIKSFPISPSIIVDSGSGFHSYWLLNVPLYNIATAKCVLSKIQEKLQADANAKLTTQLLRVPYSHNLKKTLLGGQAVEVKIIEASVKKYSIQDFISALGITESDIQENSIPKISGKKKSLENAEKRKHSGTLYNGIIFDFKKKPAPLNLKIDNFPELLDTLKKQNILIASNIPNYPLGSTFNCCFHDDSNPSANVFIGKDGYYYYKCFGCNRVYDIITIYQELTKQTFPQAIIALSDYFGIKFKYQKWIIDQWEKYYHNANILVNFEKYGYDSMYPNAYKLIEPRLKYLHLMNEYGLGHLSSIKYSHEKESLFFVSYEYFTNNFGKDYSITLNTAKKSINLFCTLGILKKVPISEIPADIATKAVQEAQNTNDRFQRRKTEPVNFYIMYNIHDKLATAEERAGLLFKNGFKIGKTMNKDFLIISLGQELADEIYPDGRKVNKANASIAGRLETTLIDLISKNGYAAKDQIVSKTKLSGRLCAGRNKKEQELDKYFMQMLNRHNLEYVRANKSLMEALNLKKSIYIIIPKGLK